MAEPGGLPEPLVHVLLVEDSEIVRGALRILFEETGRRVTLAANVAEAVTALEADLPDIVLLDLTLPDGDGLAVASAARTRAESSGTRAPVLVALTGRDEPAVIERCRDAGCADVLLKPVPARELLSRVDALLAARV